tara:strand:+ start:181 stop:516 length:336 start_codon:yes stop_codon:yes gene_type:complete
MKAKEDLEITNITRTEMNPIDLSDKIKYSAQCVKHSLTLCSVSDGIFHKHMTLEEWTINATELFREKLNEMTETLKDDIRKENDRLLLIDDPTGKSLDYLNALHIRLNQLI